MKINNFTPSTIVLQELGRRLSQIRKQQGFTQDRLAEEAGIGVATLRRIEVGQDSQISSWIKILGALKITTAIDNFLPEAIRSPRQDALAQKKKTRHQHTSPTDFRWGDEQI